MAFCSNCGSPLVEGAAFCSGCGAKIIAEKDCKPTPDPVPTPAPDVNTGATANTTVETRKFNPLGLLAVIASALVYIIHCIPLQVITRRGEMMAFSGFSVINNGEFLSTWWGEAYYVALMFNLTFLSAATALFVISLILFCNGKNADGFFRTTVILSYIIAAMYNIEGLVTVFACSETFSPFSLAFLAPMLMEGVLAAMIVISIIKAVKAKRNSANS